MATISGITPVGLGVRQAINQMWGSPPPASDSLPHQKWRLRVIEPGTDANYIAFAEIQFFALEDIGTPVNQTFGSSTYADPYVSASSYVSTSYPPWEAFNGVTASDGWVSGSGDRSGAWIQYDFGSSDLQNIVGVKAYWAGAYGIDTVPASFVVEYSDDGETWITKFECIVPEEDKVAGSYSTFWAGDIVGASASLPLLEADAVMTETPFNTYKGTDFTVLQPYSCLGRIDPQNLHELPAYTGEGVMYAGNTAELDEDLPTRTGTAAGISGTIATGSATIPAVTVEATIPPASNASLPSYEAQGAGFAGKVFSGSGIIPSFSAEAAGVVENVSTGSAEIPVYTITAQASGEGLSSANITLKAITLSAAGYAGSVSTVAVVLPAYEVDAEGNPQLVGDVAVTLPLLELEATGDNGDALGQTGGAFTLNMKRRGLTQFTGYNFNSFAIHNGVTLAAGPNGIFAISGETDNGVAIDASFKIHAKGNELHRLRSAVVNCRADGDVVITVIPDEQDEGYEYTLSKSGTNLSKSRAKLGRGIKAPNFQFEVRNVDGADFEIDYISIETTPTSRKV